VTQFDLHEAKKKAVAMMLLIYIRKVRGSNLPGHDYSD
jgi:hypothetical protein